MGVAPQNMRGPNTLNASQAGHLDPTVVQWLWKVLVTRQDPAKWRGGVAETNLASEVFAQVPVAGIGQLEAELVVDVEFHGAPCG